ncbi:MAG: hypothetical protein LBU34_17905 [Planctomycetaceae bacterium]|nr:hypothetical protein [Planctomycetaceae bacterium]
MIQEQISTSSPKCLDGNSGFGIVAQTSGMAPNVAREVSMLSGYTHQFAAGDSRNPVTFLHVVRRTGGTNRHIVSRVADCGNDYSGRTNRIAHHWIIEESDLSGLSCGPAAILLLQNFFFFFVHNGTKNHRNYRVTGNCRIRLFPHKNVRRGNKFSAMLVGAVFWRNGQRTVIRLV